ncbi:MAG: hypothetical protein QOF35_742 [Actinomycetota bacterium]|nr:hypothetical protein [Actinomycetota bacterium]
MTTPTRRALDAVMAAVGIVFLVVGAWFVVVIGPSGEASFTSTSKAPGAVVVPANVLNAVDGPVTVKATRRDGGALFLGTAASSDAHAILARSAVSTVKAVHYPAGALELSASGAGALTDVSTSDVWRLASKGSGSAKMVVDQSGDSSSEARKGPETAVVASGDSTALRDVTVTLAWTDRAWFFEALATAVIGGLMAMFALSHLRRSSVRPVRSDVAQTQAAEAVQ